MFYSRQGEYLTVSRITGPRHNLLQLRLTQDPNAEPRVERMPAVGTCVHGPLSDQAVLDAVMAGIAHANAELGTAYAIDRARFIDNDCPPEGVYGMLAALVIRRLHSGGEFVAS
ncbi:hypothetical protein RDV84_10615 [Lysobacter yananisis]|uniref:Uncharacterized protein n=1 Tax=Lysobacter yananisis TaxID=1003114 RepID=A0ABY9PDW6_9GAMM|nr:hypothetical protein [Lysobacter yananisis]WMT05270.1 hypothetical protein RDV84_10615 [Lysobacter yananisis]